MLCRRCGSDAGGRGYCHAQGDAEYLELYWRFLLGVAGSMDASRFRGCVSSMHKWIPCGRYALQCEELVADPQVNWDIVCRSAATQAEFVRQLRRSVEGPPAEAPATPASTRADVRQLQKHLRQIFFSHARDLKDDKPLVRLLSRRPISCGSGARGKQERDVTPLLLQMGELLRQTAIQPDAEKDSEVARVFDETKTRNYKYLSSDIEEARDDHVSVRHPYQAALEAQWPGELTLRSRIEMSRCAPAQPTTSII